MYQGLLGTFPFTVLEQEVCTFRDLKFSREQVYAEHRVLAGIPCLQHMGRNLDPVSLTVQIVPLTPVSTVGLRLRLLESVAASGDEMALVIGLKYYGLYVLKSYEITHRQLHYGVTLSAEVQLALQGAEDFLNTAFLGWVRQKNIDIRENCDFHDPENSCWFPAEEES